MDHSAWVVCTFGLLGLVLGSFYAVVIHRLPLGQSVIMPRSACPNCSRQLVWRELVPVVSFLALRGRCRTCAHHISYRYPLVELMTSLGFAGVYVCSESWQQVGVGLTLFSFLIILSWIDMEHMILPDRLTISGAVVGVGFSIAGWTGIDFGQSLLGWAVGVTIVLAVSIVSRGGMGGGDIKLLGMIGAFLGPMNAALILFIASFLGAVIGVILVITGRRQRRDPLPFGPFLALAAAVVWCSPDSVTFGFVPFFS